MPSHLGTGISRRTPPAHHRLCEHTGLRCTSGLRVLRSAATTTFCKGLWPLRPPNTSADTRAACLVDSTSLSAIAVHVNGGPKSASPTRVTSATANCQYPTATYPRINGPAHANVCFLRRRHACSGPPPGSPLSIWGHEPAKPYAPTTTTADSGDGQLTAATGAMPQLHRRHLLFRRRLRFKCTSPTTLAALLPGNTPVHSGSTSNAQMV